MTSPPDQIEPTQLNLGAPMPYPAGEVPYIRWALRNQTHFETLETVMKHISVLLLASFFSATAFAGSITAKVVQVRIDQSGQGMVFFDQPLSGSPSCILSSFANALAFNTNTAAGRSIVALALAAKATGDTVAVYGAGNCSIYGGQYVEDWSYGVVQ